MKRPAGMAELFTVLDLSPVDNKLLTMPRDFANAWMRYTRDLERERGEIGAGMSDKTVMVENCP